MKRFITTLFSYVLLSASIIVGLNLFSVASAQTTNSPRCPQINQNLWRGLRDAVPNGDILRLQTFLAYEGVFNTEPSGYFGAVTESSLAAWQYRNNIRPAIGVFGPLTRARVAARCSTGAVPNPVQCPVIPMAYPNCPNGTVIIDRDTRGCTTGYRCSATSTGYGTPTISSFTGPATLSVGQTGTWSLTAFDPQNEQLTYSIRWGDEGSNYTLSAPSASQYVYGQTTTFTHVYSVPGTYTVLITVRDQGGLQAQTTASVVVGGSTSGYSSIRVTYPNSGGTFTRNQALNLSWTDSNTYIQAPRYDLYITNYAQPCQYGYYCTQQYQVQQRYPIATSVYGTSYNWVVPSGLAGGQYVLEVCAAGASTGYASGYSCDQSDTYFTIDGAYTTDGVTLVVNPSSGSAPLQTTATVTITPVGTTYTYCNSNNAVLDWGDGSSDSLYQYGACSSAQQTYTRSHSYAQAGTYTVRVLRDGVSVSQLTVTVSGTSGSGYITSAYIDRSNVSPGQVLTTTWTTQNVPSNTSLALQLIDSSGQSYGYLTVNQSPYSGSYTWTVPQITTSCPPDSPYVCGNNIAGKTFFVRAVLYTPSNACFGYCGGNQPSTITTRDTSQFTVSGSTGNTAFASLTAPSSVVRGGTLNMQWTTTGAPTDSRVRVFLMRVGTNANVGAIGWGSSLQDSFNWVVPQYSTSQCPVDTDTACASNITDGQYFLRAIVHTPANACFGYCPSGTQPTTIATRDSTVFTIGGATTNDAVSLNIDPVAYNLLARTATVYVTRSSTGGESNTTLTYATLDWGDGSTEALTYQGGVSANLSFAKSHTYAAGTYTVRLIKNGVTIVSQQITVDATAGGGTASMNLTISANSGSSYRSVTATTNTPVSNTTCGVNGTLLLDWGDGTSVSISSPYAGSNGCTYESRTFTHTYISGGTFNASIRNNAYPYQVYVNRSVIVN